MPDDDTMCGQWYQKTAGIFLIATDDVAVVRGITDTIAKSLPTLGRRDAYFAYIIDAHYSCLRAAHVKGTS